MASGMTGHKDSDDNDIQLSFLPHPLLCLLPFLYLKMGFLHMGSIGHEQR